MGFTRCITDETIGRGCLPPSTLLLPFVRPQPSSLAECCTAIQRQQPRIRQQRQQRPIDEYDEYDNINHHHHHHEQETTGSTHHQTAVRHGIPSGQSGTQPQDRTPPSRPTPPHHHLFDEDDDHHHHHHHQYDHDHDT